MSGIPGIYKNGRPELGGTIGVVSSDLARYSDFAAALAVMAKPDGARLVWTKTVDVAGNCNAICRNAVGNWVWFMGDDHVFNPDILLRLLNHDVDVVVPLCFTRTPPYVPVVYSGQDAGGNYMVHKNLPAAGLHEIYAAGSAGMLVKRHVLDNLADPWFTPSPGAEGLNEDLHFCQKVREAGFSIWCDVGTPLGHIAPHTVWPDYREGGWHPNLILSPQVVMPLLNIEAPEESLAASR